MEARRFRPGTFIEAGRHWTFVLNDNQNLLGKCMLFLNRTEIDATQATPDEWLALRVNLAIIRNALLALFQPDQFNYAFLMNAESQVHLHVVPRYATPRQWDSETFLDPEFGSLFDRRENVLNAERLEALGAAIRERMPEAIT